MEQSGNIAQTLASDIFLLRPWRVADAAWYVQARDEQIFQWTTEKRELTVAETEEAIRQVNASTGIFCFAITDHQTQALLGNIALVFEESPSRNAEIMYWLAPEGRGRGIATKAVRLLCDGAFHALGAEQITLQTHRDNVRSQMVAERAGFRLDERKNQQDSAYVWFNRLKHT